MSAARAHTSLARHRCEQALIVLSFFLWPGFVTIVVLFGRTDRTCVTPSFRASMFADVKCMSA